MTFSLSSPLKKRWNGKFIFLCTCFVLLRVVECLIKNEISSMAVENEDDCVISLALGKLRGNCSNLIYDAYTRIPYAQPPVGDLRFESPKPIVDKWTSILEANGERTMCVQFFKNRNPFMGSEDCLYVHVYVPKTQKLQTSQNKSTKLPVIIWIHPGAFQFGFATNNPEIIMSDGGIIFVAMTYRVGPLGFLSTNDKRIPGNFGLKDQRLAIKWVYENIAAFGGDKDNIILLGNSAGGASVEYQMITNSTSAKAYVSLSGSIFNPWAFVLKPEKTAQKFGKLLNCNFNSSGDEFKKCLKSKTAEELWQVTMDMHEYYAFNNALFRPTIESTDVEDAFLTQHPIKQIKMSKYNKKRYLIGTVEDEGAYMAAFFMQLNDNNKELIEDLNKSWDDVCPLMFFTSEEEPSGKTKLNCAELKQKYMCNQSFSFSSYKLLEKMFGDQYFYKGINTSVELHQANGQEIYRYVAKLINRYNIGNVLSDLRKDLCFGAVHTSDIFSIAPLDFGFPKRKFEKEQMETLNAFIGLLKSMIDDARPPTFKNIKLPIVNANDTKHCLNFSYGTQKIDSCEATPIDCKNVPSIKCKI